MKFRCHALQSAVAVAAATCALSASADIPQRAICTVQQAIACDSFNPCSRALPAAANLPALMRIEVDTGVIESRHEDGEIRTSKIASSSTHEDVLVLQGNDDGHPWAIRVNTKSGDFTLSVLREDEGYVGFGVCSSKILK